MVVAMDLDAVRIVVEELIPLKTLVMVVAVVGLC